MAQGGAFFGFAIVLAIVLVTLAIVLIVEEANNDDSSDDYAGPRDADNDIQV